MSKYCDAIYKTERRKTRTVWVGKVAVGSEWPVRIQSMTTSSTRDVEATVHQAMRLVDAGCEIVRVTVQGIKEAESCEAIKNELVKKGYDIPLVADIHFFPPAALRVADFVDKIRINPGNFADKRASFKVIEYDDASYAEELVRIEEKFSPLVEKCKKLKRAMRIGTNHGSLSDRIMNRYGDTPAGMVESALEFARIARKMDYHDLFFSMKASNPQVMIQAYRLLTKEMYKLGWDYPLHLGVTEAGDGEDGRIKSAIGIGSLLLDGIGDTVRVSLTEDPWFEIDPCQRLIKMATEPRGIEPFQEIRRPYFYFNKRKAEFSSKVSMHKEGSVWVEASEESVSSPTFFDDLGLNKKKTFADGLVLKKPFHHEKFQTLQEKGISIIVPKSLKEAHFQPALSLEPQVILIEDEWEGLQDVKAEGVIFRPRTSLLHQGRKFYEWLQTHNLKVPVIFAYDKPFAVEDYIIQASSELGSLFCDGFGDGVLFEIAKLNFGFNLLQAVRKRIIKTDFISCPSCGRTLFDLQDVTREIKKKTEHLAGVKIAIMGCIVNGPGEMADADFGYVGSKPGKIDLYVGKACVEKDIEFTQGPDRLVELIKTHGRWVEPLTN